MITGYNHTSITVGDMDTMLGFYRDIIGMRTVSEVENRADDPKRKGSGFEGLHMKVVKLMLGNFMLELIEYVNKKGQKLDTRPTNIGAFHVAFTCDDITKTYNELVEKGIKFKQAPFGHGYPKAVYGFDPEGNRFEITDDVRWVK